MIKPSLSQADYMEMYRDTGDPKWLAEMVTTYGVLPSSGIAQDVADAIIKGHPKNKDWENRHDFICALFHTAKQDDPKLTYDTGAIIVFEEFCRLKLNDEFDEIRIKKILQRKYEDYARDNK